MKRTLIKKENDGDQKKVDAFQPLEDDDDDDDDDISLLYIE